MNRVHCFNNTTPLPEEDAIVRSRKELHVPFTNFITNFIKTTAPPSGH